MGIQRKTKWQVGMWIGSVFGIMVVGLTFMPLERDHPGFWEAFYSTLRLFVFERDLPTFPQAWPLIVIYFAAPLVTLSALGTAISYFLRLTPMLTTRWLREHVIIGGMGKHGRLLAETLLNKGVRVVGIDLGPRDRLEEWAARNEVPMFYGDFNSRTILTHAGVRGARSILFASGDDLANLEGALLAYDWMQTHEGPVRLIWTHLENERLAESARFATRTEGKVGLRFFDIYEIAARGMIARHFNRSARKETASIVILGFGKFGRDLLSELVKDLGPEERPPIRVIDRDDRAAEVRAVAERLSVIGRVSFEQADIRKTKLKGEPGQAVFLCTDDDMGNLMMAISLVDQRFAGRRIFVRMACWPMSAVEQRLAEEGGAKFVNVNELVAEGIADLPGLFVSAAESDLKRRRGSY